MRGNHDAYRGQHEYAGDEWIELPGVDVALLDTVIPSAAPATCDAEQLDWLDAGAAASTVPVMVMGHHQQCVSGATRSPDYFGIDPDASDALSEVMRRRPAIVAYTAGHTHRHRVRWVDGTIPSIEVGCVKDFPGTWAEYRVYDGGILQVVHRMSTPEALAWSEQCRTLYSDFGVDYATYAMGSARGALLRDPVALTSRAESFARSRLLGASSADERVRGRRGGRPGGPRRRRPLRRRPGDAPSLRVDDGPQR